MAKTLITTGGSESQGANITRYYNFGGGELEAGNATEAVQYFTIQTAGTVSNMYIRVTANTNTADSTMRFRKNTGNGNQVLTITAETTGDFEDTTNTDSVVAGDEIDWAVTTGNGTNAITISVMGGVFNAATSTQTFSTIWNNFATAGTTYVVSLCDPELQTTGAENRTQLNFATGGIMENLYVYLASNTRADNSTLGVRINGSNGTCSVTITAGVAGIFEDTTNQDTITAGDLVNLTVLNGAGTGSMALRTVKTEFTTTNRTFVMGGIAAAGGSAGQTMYAPPYFSSQGGVTIGNTEANFQTDTNFAFTASDLWILCSSYSSGNCTATLRVNGADSALTIAATGAGEFIDTVNEVSIAATDEINYKWAWSGTNTVRGLSMLGTTTIVPPTITGISTVTGLSTLTF